MELRLFTAPDHEMRGYKILGLAIWFGNWEDDDRLGVMLVKSLIMMVVMVMLIMSLRRMVVIMMLMMVGMIH